MADKEKLLEPTESYLKSLISEVAQLSIEDSDLSTPFQELGLDSFRVLQIIKKLEEEFGTLPKTLLFENFNISDLSNYFVDKYEQVLLLKFTNEKQTAVTPVKEPSKNTKALAEKDVRPNNTEQQKHPILILEEKANKHPELGVLYKKLFNGYKNEGSASRGTRNIAPNLFIGSEKRGYFNYCRSKNIILVYAYTGPRDYFPAIAEEIREYCTNNSLELSIFTDEQIDSIGEVPFSATPFGVISRVVNIKEFSLQGNKMRRLRYQVSKFESAGKCRTEEYKSGTNKEIDKNIVSIVEQWCEPRTMVNPLIHIVKDEIKDGRLSSEHRLFLTYLDDVLQNAILISSLSAETNGYLMDLEFYPPNMPLGGLEYGIIKMIGVLAAEGCDILSLGGTYGCKLAPSSNADPVLDSTLNYLREQNIFNDGGNLQFKNKFRPEHSTIFLCRDKENSNPDNVTDIIMMIADPTKMQTSDEEHHTYAQANQQKEKPDEAVKKIETSIEPEEIKPEKVNIQEENTEVVIEGEERSAILSDFNFNPLNIPNNKVAFDLKTDSWAQLETPAIQNQISYLKTQLQQAVDLDKSLKSIFPFSYFVLTDSGRTAEHTFFKSWPEKGVVLQNLLFPTTIFHQIDNGYTPLELPSPEVFKLNSTDAYKGGLDLELLQKQVGADPKSIAMVLIELNDNAAGGAPVSIQHLKQVKALLSKHSIPLVMDGTRVIENARFIIENEKEFTKKNTWEVVHEVFSCADAVITSLAKDFCIDKGGLIATNDINLYNKLSNLVQEEGSGLDVIDKKLLALSLQNRHKIEKQVLNRIESVQLVGKALTKHGIPIVQPTKGHCILIDVKQIPEFRQFKYPVASFVAWMFLNTGIRAGAHNAGMQKGTSINDLVRLAIPVGTNRKQIEEMISRLILLFERKENIPEILLEGNSTEALADIHTKYTLKKYHNPSGKTIPKNAATLSTTEKVDPILEQMPEVAQTKNIEGGNKTNNTHQDIAIVGMSGRYPKAKNMNELWEVMAQGKDCIELIPDERYEQRLQTQFTQKFRGGFIDDVDKFDSLFFNISPREAEMLDPQERLFLEVAWEAIEDAGYYPEILGKDDDTRNVGVFVGAVWAMYQMLGAEQKILGKNLTPSSFLWSIANRVSYCLNFTGPSLTLDTACSSSLTAIYLACEAIKKGDCSSAIVGGVNLDLHQSKWDADWAEGGGALSKDGLCRTFGKGANGYVPGEGVGALYLKTLEQAEKDGDNIYGIIKGVAINHGGKTSGFMVPSPNAQAKLVQSALKSNDIDARSISYIEAHGTGTELGDPIEISGLTNAFQEYNVDTQSCPIGSVKTNIGHLEAAAGIVGLQKVILQMQHSKLVPSLHSSELNEFIDFENSPFYVQQTLEEWKPKDVDGIQVPLRAGVSSFGAGGANAHVIIEKYEPKALSNDETRQPGERTFPLSARNDEQLHEMAVRLRDFIQRNLNELNPALQLNLDDVAYTLQLGRKSFEYRLAIFANNHEELIEKLTHFIEGKKDGGILAGRRKNAEGITKLLSRNEKKEFINLLSKSQDSHKLAQLWIDGLINDWQDSQNSPIGKRISLPTYPFAKVKCWLDLIQDISVIESGTKSAELHPLLHTNTSDFNQQSYRSVFNGKEFFISNHKINGQKALPATSLLELARVAIATAMPIQEESGIIELRNIVWTSPVIITDEKELSISLFVDDNEDISYEILSGEAGEETIYSQGEAILIEPASITLDINQLKKEIGGNGLEISSFYDALTELGLHYGKELKGLEEVYLGENQLLAKIKVPSSIENTHKEYALHPSIMESVVQATIALSPSVSQALLPVALESLTILSACPNEIYAWVHYADGGQVDHAKQKLDIELCDEQGNLCVAIKGLELSNNIEASTLATGVSSNTNMMENSWDKMSFQCKWVEQEEQPLNAPVADKNILLVSTGSSLEFKSAIVDFYKKSKNCNIHSIQLGEKTEKVSDKEWLCGIHDTKGFQTCLNNNNTFDTIFFLAMTEPQADSVKLEEVVESQESNEIQLLRLVKYIKENNKVAEKVDTYILTFDNYSVSPQPNNFMGGGITGLAYSLAHGSHHFNVRNIDLSLNDFKQSEDKGKLISGIINEPASNKGDIIKYQSGKRYGQSFYKLNWDKTERIDVIKQGGVYLIVGGSGTVGQIFTRNLIQKYEATVVWIGRSAESSEKIQKTLQTFEQHKDKVKYIQADVTKLDSMQQALKTIKKTCPHINGALFAGLVFESDNSMELISEKEFRAIIDVKTLGSWNFYKVLEKEPLDFLCYFSSGQAYSFTGASKVAGYATGITFTDSLVQHFQNKSAFHVGIINWGFWGASVKKLMAESGVKNVNITSLDDQEGFEGFERFVNELQKGRITQFLCMKANQQLESMMGCVSDKILAVKEGQTSYEVVPVENPVAKIEENNQPKKQQTPPAKPLIAKRNATQQQKPATAPKASKNIEEHVKEVIQNCLSNALKIPYDSLEKETAFFEYGLDSMLGVVFIEEVNKCLSIDMNPAITFEFFTVNNLGKHVVDTYQSQIEALLDQATDDSKDSQEEPQETIIEELAPQKISTQFGRRLTARNIGSRNNKFKRSNSKKPEIAVIGMSGLFPKAENTREFWKNIIQGVDGVEELPAEYLDPACYTTEKKFGKTRCKWGGIVKDRDCFDPLFFKISPKEAEGMNPHQRLVLQEGWKAIEDAGYNPKDLSGSKTGVYIGSEPIDYATESFTGYSDAIIAARLSYVLNLTGPAFVVDTACSASAVAIHLACESLRSHESDMAVAGGVNAHMNQSVQIACDDIEILSPTGTCKTFDSEGNGTIISEGIGMVYLKRLDDAIEAGDHIYGVICGSGVNQDGASNGITAPNGAAQEELIKGIYNKFEINPEQITCFEAHGTGTTLGDPVESNALVRVFKKYTDKKEFCSVGSAKSHIGHTGAAAGVIGLIKVLLSMQHKQLPQLLHFTTLNPLIQFKDSPFYINTTATEWKSPEGTPRMAALNSFGHGGTNAHLVIKEHLSSAQNIPSIDIAQTNGAVAIPLSAKTGEQLRQKAIDLFEFIQLSQDPTNPSSRKLDLVAMAYTLQIGREPMSERLGFIVNSIEQLSERLQEYINNQQKIENLYQGSVKQKNQGMSILNFNKDDDMKETLDKWIVGKKYPKLLDLWVNGLDLDWGSLYGENKPSRISLPAYPFAKERYWLSQKPREERTTATISSEVIHPVLQNNISNLYQQCYSSVFNGEEFFIKDHEVNGEKVMPAVAFLEMARAAIQNALPGINSSVSLELHNTQWGQPVVVSREKQIKLALFEEGDEQVAYEIYSEEAEGEIIHCKGKVLINHNPEVATLDVQELQGQMKDGESGPNKLNTTLNKLGVNYGSSFQTIETIYVGGNQRLVKLSLPEAQGQSQDTYGLHPGLMEGAFQAAMSLIIEQNKLVSQPLYPLAADFINIYAPCTKEMFAWVRNINISGTENNPETTSAKLDIDLCNEEGKICVQLRGISLQNMAITAEVRPDEQHAIEIKELSTSPQNLQKQEESENLFYQEHWIEQAATTEVLSAESHQMIIFADKDTHDKIVGSSESEWFKEAVFVYQAERFKKESEHVYHCKFNTENDVQKILDSTTIEKGKTISLVYTWAKGKEEAGVHALFNLFKTIKASAQPVTNVTIIGHYDPSSVESCWDYSWIGFERSLKMLLPKTRISLLYINTSTYTPEQIIDASQQSGTLWYKNNQRFTLAFKPVELNKTKQEPVIKKGGSYLITGGCGGLGLKFSNYLAEKYQAKLILLGRSPISASIQEKIEALTKAGAQEVLYYSVDICDQKALNTWAKKLPTKLSGIIHAAGVGSTQPFHEKSTDEINKVLHPKTIGTLFIDEALSKHPLDFVCYFSSSSALIGDGGPCDYAIGNRYQMAYAYHRDQKSQSKGKSIVINWPLWQEGGMSVGDAQQTEIYLKSSGLDILKTSVGLEIWHDLMQIEQIQTLILLGKPTRINNMLQRFYEPEKAPQKQVAAKDLPAFTSKGWKSKNKDLSPKECVIFDIKHIISTEYKIALNKLDISTNLIDYGFDSISIATFSKQLQEYFSIEITPSLFYNYNTIEQLGEYFSQDHSEHIQEFYREPQNDKAINGKTPENEPQKSSPRSQGNLTRSATTRTRSRRTYVPQSSNMQEPIAIIGVSGRFPKADTVEQLWELLAEGKSGIAEIPPTRWDWHDYYTKPDDTNNKIITNKGGFINNIEEFDPSFFNITPQEAEMMDPGQRLLLMEAYHAIEDAGLDPTSLRGANVGVFVGMEESQFAPPSGMQGLANGGNAMVTSRLSYYLDLHGPTIATNTACSSGLVALHQAAMSIRQKECEAALVAGIALTLSPMSYVAMSQSGMLSKDGLSYSLANNANGMGIGEAVAVLMLKPLSAAVANGDNIYGTIKASGINFDGKTNGITAPSGQMQAALIENIYTNYKIQASDINHIVTHASGTKLGDSVEINALNKVFKKLMGEQQQLKQKTNCAITSCKSNLGHTMAASGLVSAISLLKGIQHQKIPASIYCEKENDYITWKDSPFYINKTTQEWKKEGEKPYLGGVNAFGRSGTNAHVVLEEYQPSVETEQPEHKTVMLPLSARNKEQLKQRVQDLLDFIRQPQHNGHLKESPKRTLKTIDLTAMAYTLQVGREAMDERIGFLVESMEQLEEKLQSYVEDNQFIENVYQGNVEQNQEGLSIINQDDEIKESIIDKWIADNKFSKLLDLWVKGLAFDWNKLYDDIKPRRISLPGYPFAKEKYWINITQAEPLGANDRLQATPITNNEEKPARKGEYQFSLATSDTKDKNGLGVENKIGLFLKQEIAEQLQVPIQKVGTSQTFMELGMGSSGLISLIQKTNEFLQENLSPSVFFDYNTIPKITEYLLETCPEKINKIVVSKSEKETKTGREKIEKATNSGILVPLQAKGDTEPIFGIPGADGNVLSLMQISQALGDEQPFYGFEAIGLDGKTPHLSSIEEIAKANIAAMQTIQKKGPYCLLGYSNGGVVAYEMARLLLKQKETIAALIMLDTLCPLQREGNLLDPIDLIVNVCENLTGTSGEHLDLDVKQLQQIQEKKRGEYVYEILKSNGLDFVKKQFIESFNRSINMSMSSERCCIEYKPVKTTQKIDVTLFRANQGYKGMPDDYGWNQLLISPVQVHRIKANHFNLIDKEHAQEIAKTIKNSFKVGNKMEGKNIS